MRIVAYDLSLRKTGAAIADDPLVRSETIVYPGSDQGVKRLRWLRSVLVEKAMPADLVILEGYAYKAHGRGVSLGELGGAVRVGLADVGIPFVVVPPKSRAKYATGRGDADKYEVLAAAVRRLGYEGGSHDEADALWLFFMAQDHFKLPARVRMPAQHRAALAGVQWPDEQTIDLDRLVRELAFAHPRA